MNEKMRLFDCIDLQLQKFPKPDMFAAKEEGHWKTYSTETVKTIVNNLSAGLLNLGLSGRDMTAEAAVKLPSSVTTDQNGFLQIWLRSK